MLTPTLLAKLRALIAAGREWEFYSWSQWLRRRGEVLELDHHECQLCRAQGRYRRGKIVHHVKHLRDRPDLALSIFDPDTGERQLLTVCKTGHELEHPEAFRQYAPKAPPLTAERWD